MADHRTATIRTERVVLPEPGRTLLRRTYPILVRRFADEPGRAGFILGGGTMLAARWGHRASKDLDIKVNNAEGCRAVSRMYEEPLLEVGLDRAMHGAGARGKKRSSPLEFMYIFGNEDDLDPPRIELVELAPKLRGQIVRPCRPRALLRVGNRTVDADQNRHQPRWCPMDSHDTMPSRKRRRNARRVRNAQGGRRARGGPRWALP